MSNGDGIISELITTSEHTFSVMEEETERVGYRIVFFSDTYGLKGWSPGVTLPKGDMFIHCGNFTNKCAEEEIDKFIVFLKNLPYERKIVIAGNHEKDHLDLLHSKLQPPLCEFIEKGDIVLEKTDVHIHLCSYKMEEDSIPEGTHILVTHEPPSNILDWVCRNTWPIKSQNHCGSKNIMKLVNAMYPTKENKKTYPPLVHFFGHVSQQRGIHRDRKTAHVNVCLCNEERVMDKSPIICEITERIC